MRLISLELHGFKSFADKTKITFANGISSVVGPNGCGKSNVVDAIAWVLGEQSAKSLRAEKMGDVLFAGAKNRKAQNFAEVTIEFSNVDAKIPLPFKTISISRRLLRSGESEYLLNKRPVRLKEIHELMCHTGLSVDSFSIIGQGKIGEEVLKSPESRRRSFDAIAGVSRTLQRRKETLERLKKSKEHIEKAKIKNEQLLEQLAKLKLQSEEVHAWNEMQARRDNLQLVLQQQAFLCLREKLDKGRKKQELLQQEAERLEHACIEIQKELVGLKEASQTQWVAVKKAQEEKERRFATLQVIKHTKEQESQKWQAIQRRLKSIKDEYRQAESRRTEVQEELISLRAKYLPRKALHAEQTLQLKNIRASLDEMESHFSRGLGDLQEKQQALGVQKIKLQEKKNSLERSERQEKKLQEMFERLEKEKNSLLLKDCSLKQGQVEEVKNGLSAKFQELQQEVKRVTSELHDTEHAFEAVSKNRKQVDSERLMLQSRYTALLQMVQDGVGLSEGAKKLYALIKNKKLLGSGLQSLAEFFKEHPAVDKIGQLLSSYFLIDTNEQLQKVVPLLRSEKISDVTILCLEHLNTSQEEIVRQFKDALICSSFEESALSSSILLIEGVGVWRRASGLTLQLASKQHPFLHSVEAENLQKKMHPLEVRSNKLLEEEKAFAQKKQQLLEKRQSLEKEIRVLDRQLFEVTAQLCELARDLQVTRDRSARIEREIQDTVDELKGIKKEIQELGAEVAKESALFQGLKKVVDQQDGEFKQFVQQRADLVQRVKRETTSLEQEQLALHAQEKRIYQLESEEHHIQELLETLQAESLRVDEQLQFQTQKIEQEKIEQVGVEADFKQAELLLLTEESKRDELQGKIKSAEESLEKKRQAHKQLIEKRVSVERDIAVLEHEEKEFEGLFLPEKVVYYSKTELEEFQQEIQRLTEMLDGKQVNFKAIEEYTSLEASCSESLHQLQDLEVSEQALLTLLDEVEQEAQSKFMETFEQIQKAFSDVFQRLFGGGEANLILTPAEDGDFFSSGVEIIAQPPGKQMRLLSLLSGGEKSLTALALLFAFFQISPSPCCILDEVDAPLDEANVERLAKALRSFSSSTQFILVTHNKRTMAVSDQIIGVTMEEKGISKVLELELVQHQTAVTA